MGKIGLWIVDKYRNFRKKRGEPAVSSVRLQRYRRLYPAEEPERFSRIHDGKLVARLCGILLFGTFACVAGMLLRDDPGQVTELERPEYGGGDTVYELLVEQDGKEAVPLEISVAQKECTEEEAERNFAMAYEEILEKLPTETVTASVDLPEAALNGLVTADWTSQTRGLFDDWGGILKTPGEIAETGEEGRFLLELTCGIYSRTYEISFMAYPAGRTETERFLDDIQEELKEQMKTGNGVVSLPSEYRETALVWYEGETEENQSFFFLLPAAVAALLAVKSGQREKELLKKREREMLLDYPELISKFIVLLQAGMTVRNVWERLVREYERKKRAGEKSRYAYEEMRITRDQLKNGVYESVAYGEFGRRCGLHVYMKFSALLEQNLKQGTTELSARLREEAEAAFEERKALAKRLGEEAETKLMLPMFMMLAVVLIIVMVPAFLSF